MQSIEQITEFEDMSKDVRISTSLPDHPKTKRLIRRLGAGGAWFLVRLFIWTASNRSDGDLTGLSDDDLELAIDYTGQEGEFISALEEFGFLDGQEMARSIHDWSEHNPWAAGAGMRSAKAQWNAVKRHHGEEIANLQVPEYAADRNASSMLVASDAHAGSNAPSPSPSPSPSPKQDGETGSRKRSSSKPSIAKPEDVQQDTWDEFLEMRKRKRADLTPRVLTSLQKEATKAGWSLEQVLNESIIRGWQSFKAEWVTGKQKPVRQQQSFDSNNYGEGIEEL